jgi:hypothetical protein
MRIGGHVDFCSEPSTRASNGSLLPMPSSARMLVSTDVTSIDEYPFLVNFAS